MRMPTTARIRIGSRMANNFFQLKAFLASPAAFFLAAPPAFLASTLGALGALGAFGARIPAAMSSHPRVGSRTALAANRQSTRPGQAPQPEVTTGSFHIPPRKTPVTLTAPRSTASFAGLPTNRHE